MLVVALVLPVLLQGATPPLPVDPVPAPLGLQGVLIDQPGDGNVWVLAPSYKARFSRDGVDFIPFLGSKAPQNHPLGLVAKGGRRGERPLAWRSDAAPLVDGLRITYDRGDVREVWDLRPDAAEQTFLVSRYEGEGDLVVCLDVRTDLTCGDVDDGLCFRAGAQGSVHYGDLHTFDGADRRVVTPSHWTGNGIELRVPAAFVAGARGDLRLDPVVRAITIDNTEDAINPDVAYEPFTDRWLVVYERVFSLFDHDVIARRYSGSGNFIDEVAVTTSTRESLSPAVACGAAARDFLVAWDEDRLVGRLLRGRLRNAANTTQTSIVDLVTDSGVNVRSHVGGVAAVDARNGDYLVVFTNHNVLGSDSTVRFTRVGANGLAGATAPVSTPGEFADDAAVSRVRRSNLGWVVAYRTVGSTSISVRATLITATAAPTTPILLQTGLTGIPAVAGDGVDFAVLFSDTAGRADHDVFAALLRQSGGGLTVQGRHNLTASEPQARVTQDQFDVEVGYDGSRFTYAYHEGSISGANDMFAATFTAGATPFFSDGHRALHAATATVPERTSAIAGTAEAGGDAARYFVVWDQIGSSSSNVLGALYDGVQPGASVQVVDTHCGIVQIGLRAENTPALGGTLRVRADNIQPGSQVMLLGLPTPPVTLCPAGCKLGVLPLLLVIPGTALDLPIPDDPGILGARLAIENVMVANFGGCTALELGVALATTDTLIVTVR